MRGFGELEAVIMDRLWAADEPRSVRVVHEELSPSRRLAYTTVMTVMDNLHRKGWLSREMSGRAYLYRPADSRQVYSAELMSEALAASGDPQATFLAFLRKLTPEEADQLRSALSDTGNVHSRRSPRRGEDLPT